MRCPMGVVGTKSDGRPLNQNNARFSSKRQSWKRPRAGPAEKQLSSELARSNYDLEHRGANPYECRLTPQGDFSRLDMRISIVINPGCGVHTVIFCRIVIGVTDIPSCGN